MKTVAERVLAGVMWLDMVAPDWRGRVDLDYLDMHHTYECIIGQVFGNYWDAKTDFSFTNDDMIALGFQADAGFLDEYGQLTDAWKAAHSS